MQIAPIQSLTTNHLPLIARKVTKARECIGTATGVLTSDPATADAKMGVAASAAGVAAETLYDLGKYHGPEEALREALVAADALAECARNLDDPEDGGDFGRERITKQLQGIDRTLASIEHALGLTHAQV